MNLINTYHRKQFTMIDEMKKGQIIKLIEKPNMEYSHFYDDLKVGETYEITEIRKCLGITNCVDKCTTNGSCIYVKSDLFTLRSTCNCKFVNIYNNVVTY